MKTLLLHVGVLSLLLLTRVHTAKATDVSGPLTVCPQGTYTYTVSNLPFDANLVHYFARLDSPTAQPFASGSVPSSGQFTVTFNSTTIGPAYIHVKVTRYIPFLVGDVFLQVDRKLPIPASPGTLIACGPNEALNVTFSPFIPFNPNDPSNTSSCLFHCAYSYSAPSNWIFTNPVTGFQSNSVTYGGDQLTLTSPSSVSNGNAGSLTVTALFSQCGYSINTQSYGSIWVGAPSLSNPSVNNSPAQSLNYIDGYAYLAVDTQGAATVTWEIDGGSGTLQPYNNSCNVTTTNFVRVRASTSNRCGAGQSYTFYLQKSDYNGYRVYPNPAKTTVKVEFEELKYVEDLVKGVNLLDDQGNLVKAVDVETAKASQHFKENKAFEFDVSKLRRGTYYLQVNLANQLKVVQLKLD